MKNEALSLQLHPHLIIKGFLITSFLVHASSQAFAFGGGSSNRTQQYYKRGVDAIGIHRTINGEQGEIFCSETNAEGQCQYWDVCGSPDNSGETIINTPDATGWCNV